MSDARRYAVWPDPRSRSRSRALVLVFVSRDSELDQNLSGDLRNIFNVEKVVTLKLRSEVTQGH